MSSIASILQRTIYRQKLNSQNYIFAADRTDLVAVSSVQRHGFKGRSNFKDIARNGGSTLYKVIDLIKIKIPYGISY